MAYLSPQGNIYANFCDYSFEGFDDLKKIFKEHPKASLINFEEILVKVKVSDSTSGVTVYHNATCNVKMTSGDIGAPNIKEVSLRSIFDDDSIVLMQCCENLPEGKRSSLLTLSKLAEVLELHDRDFANLSLYNKDVMLEDFKYTEISFGRTSDETPFDDLYRATIEMVDKWKEDFHGYLKSAEGTEWLLTQATEQLQGSLGTAFSGHGEIYKDLKTLSRNQASEMAQAHRNHPGFVLCSKSEGFRVKDFGSGTFESLCLQRWGSDYENITALPLVVFEMLCRIENAYPDSALFLEAEPTPNVLETTASLYRSRSRGAYTSIDKAYDAALALEE